ncbi:MAG: hypothetical protein K0R73_1221 [Candidatus Midichloriaceae bacterium]|jgi:hypothetical protein|nr:hypothetical protein [Candidatus Midichloriaceae bacterium]
MLDTGYSGYNDFFYDTTSTLYGAVTNCLPNNISLAMLRKQASTYMFLSSAGIVIGALIGPSLVPLAVFTIAKAYIASTAVDYALLFAKEQNWLADTSPHYKLIKSASDIALTIIFSRAITGAVMGALTSINLSSFASTVASISIGSVAKAMAVEMSIIKNAPNTPGDKTIHGFDKHKDTFLKTVIIGAASKGLTSILGGGIIFGGVAIVAAKSLATAYIEAGKDIYKVPEKLKNINSSMGFAAQYALDLFLNPILGQMFSTSTDLSDAVSSVKIAIIESKVVAPIKESNLEARITNLYDKSSEAIRKIYNHVSEISKTAGITKREIP